MKAEAKSLRFLGEGKKLSVPFFQRRYVWEESNWQELLESFQNSEVLPFLGSIILKEESATESYIIDGQQRLTTITILTKAIYDCSSDENKKPGSGIWSIIEHMLFYKNNSADDFPDSFVKIQHSKIDKDDYERVIQSNLLNGVPSIDLDTINDSSGNVLKCYKYYCEKLHNKDDKALKGLLNSIYDESRKVFVYIQLERGDVNEQAIFDTINRAGIRLSTADIIKNNMFKKLLDAAGGDSNLEEDVLSLYKTNWDNIFNKTQQVSEIWDSERIFGNVKHTNIEFLLYCVACIKWGEDGDMFSKLESVFERETSRMGFLDLQMLVVEIKEYAQIFKKYILDFKVDLDDEEKSVYFKYEDGVRRLLLILQKFGIQMFYPYVIMRIKDVNQNDNDETLLSDFRVLESFVIRRKISARGTHDYTSKCYTIIKYGTQRLIETDLGNDNAGISDTNIRDFLSSTKDDAAKMILFWIELYRRKSHIYDVDALEFKYTLEHIMPRKWEVNWSNVPILDNDTPIPVTSEEGKSYRNRWIQAIGNKTLLTSSLNSTVKNSEFIKKINGISDSKPGYKTHTSLLLTKEVVDQAATDPNWDEKTIQQRTNSLFKEFIEIWPSFKELIHVDKEDVEENDSVERFTSEQLADPVKLLEAMESQDEETETREMVSLSEFTRMVTAQSGTIDKYVREGTIVPDSIIAQSDHRNTKLFKIETVHRYASQFGWTVITNENRKGVFMNMIDRMKMSYSYKPVFINALLDCVDEHGTCGVPEVVTRFIRFYQNRADAGLIVEKPDSIFSRANYTFDEAKHLMFVYPFKRFSDIGMLMHDKDHNSIIIDPSVWNTITEEEKQIIRQKCEKSIAEYYSNME